MLRNNLRIWIAIPFFLSALTLWIGCGSQAMISVPSGTSVVIELKTPISTETASDGDAITAETTEPILVDGKSIVPAGTTVRGYVSNVKKPGTVKGGAAITMNFQSIVTNNDVAYNFDAAPITLKGKSDTESDIERIAGTTVAGAIIGGIAKGGKGAEVGALIGAGAGGTWAVTTKGKQIVLDPGQKFRIESTEPSRMPMLASK